MARVKEVCSFPDAAEEVRIISGLRWIGAWLFSAEPVIPRAGNLLDTHCVRLEKFMAYAPGERDLVMLQHKFVVGRADGTEVCRLRSAFLCVACLIWLSKSSRRRTLEAYGAPGILRWP